MDRQREISQRWIGFALSCLGLGAASLSACSPGMFFGGDRDEKVADSRNYREVNQACAGMDLSSNLIDVPQARKILGCFNSNRALDPVERLAKRLSDAELQPLVDVVNRYVTNNKTLIYELETTYFMLAERHTLDETLKQFGKILGNGEFIASAIALMREGYVVPRAAGGSGPDRKLLKAIERIASRFTHGKFAELLDVGLTLATTTAFKDIQRRFQADVTGEPSLREILSKVLDYLRDPDPQHVPAGRRVLQEFAAGRLFPLSDRWIGATPDEIRARAAKAAALFNVTFANGGEIVSDLSTLFHYLKGPIRCLQGTKQIPAGAEFVCREIATMAPGAVRGYVSRELPLQLNTMSAVCELPPALGEHFRGWVRLADTVAIEAEADFIRILHEEGLISLLIDLFADTGSGYPGGPPEDSAGIKQLLPALSELTKRGVWEEVLLLGTLARDAERAKLADAAKFLIEPAAELGGESVYDVVTRVASRTSLTNLHRFAKSLGAFFKDGPVDLEPSLRGLRSAYYVNDAHPALDVVNRMLSEASQNERFYETLFLIAEMPEFVESIQLFSQMAQDSRLKELVGAVITLFHKFAQEGKTREILPTEEPAFTPKRRHNLSLADLAPFPSPILPEPPETVDACRYLDTRIPLDAVDQPGFDRQFGLLLACSNRGGDQDDLVATLQYLRDERSEAGVPFYNLFVRHARELSTRLGREGLDDVSDRWLRTLNDGRFDRLLRSGPFWVTHSVQGDEGAAGPVLRPFFDAVKAAVAGARVAVRGVLGYGAQVLERDDVPQILRYGEELWDQEPEPVAEPELGSYDWERIQRWVRNKECDLNAVHRRDRAVQVVDDYHNAVTGWELKDGRPKRSWSRAEYRSALEPFFQKLSDPAQNNPSKPAIQGMLNLNAYFSLEPGQRPNQRQHYARDYLAQWISERSTDHKLVSYFYPGETRPRVRLVNSIDRFELVLINADFNYILPDNFALKFLAMFGMAFGDEPWEVWPDRVRALHPEGQTRCPVGLNERERRRRVDDKICPRNLRDSWGELLATMNMFENAVGYPDRPGCSQIANPSDPRELQLAETTEYEPRTSLPDWFVPGWVKASLFNARQLMSVIEENLPGSGLPAEGGIKVLRDLFFELYTSSPEEILERRDSRGRWHGGNGPRVGWRNNLSVVLKLVRMGLGRQATRVFRKFPRIPSEAARLAPQERLDYQALLDFFGVLTQAGGSPRVSALLTEILKDREHKLLWKVLDEILYALDAPVEGGEIGPEREAELRRLPPSERANRRAEWARDLERMKQLGFYAFSTLYQMDLVESLVPTATQVVRRHYDYLAAHGDKIGKILTSRRAALLVRALWEDTQDEQKARLRDLIVDGAKDPTHALNALSVLRAIDADPAARRGWDLFYSRADALLDLDEYRRLDLGAILRDALHFFQALPGEDGGREALEIRRWAADRMKSSGPGHSGDIEEILRLAGRKPDETYQVLQTLGHHVENGQVQEFVDLIRRSVSDAAR